MIVFYNVKKCSSWHGITLKFKLIMRYSCPNFGHQYMHAALSKNEEYWLCIIEHLINISNTDNSSLKLCIIGFCFIQTKWIGCRWPLFSKWMGKPLGPCIKIDDLWLIVIVEINTLLAMLIVYYFEPLYWDQLIILYIIFLSFECNNEILNFFGQKKLKEWNSRL